MSCEVHLTAAWTPKRLKYPKHIFSRDCCIHTRWGPDSILISDISAMSAKKRDRIRLYRLASKIPTISTPIQAVHSSVRSSTSINQSAQVITTTAYANRVAGCRCVCLSEKHVAAECKSFHCTSFPWWHRNREV